MKTAIKFLTLLIFFVFSNQLIAQETHFEFRKITEIKNGYTLQSNGSPQQFWLDLNNPGYLHAVFINSQFKEPPFADRTCLYFGSIDYGVTWFQLGPVPDTSRSGFPAIIGNNEGAAVITNHSGYFGSPIRTSLFIDSNPFDYNFGGFDPGSELTTNWPRCIMVPDGNIWIASLAGDSLVLSSFNPDSAMFSKWNIGETSTPEGYTFAVSENGKIGFAFIGGEGENEGDVIYLQTTNGGITWGLPIKVFDCPAEQGIAVGALRGINLSFYGESPCLVFETCQQNFNQSGGGYYPRLPNQILFWSPEVNGGDSKIIADSSNVPFAPNLCSMDVFAPVCRPVICKSNLFDFQFVAFSAATENTFIETDTLTYFAGYWMYSLDGGNHWSDPLKFTPDSPLLDWKYISTPPVLHVIDNYPFVELTINFVLEADSLPAISDPSTLSAQYYHASSEPLIIDIFDSVDDDEFVSSCNLSQNYPNPFNPSTKIKFTFPSNVKGEMLKVSIKVYDVLGNEIATVVNEELSPGEYEVTFDVGTSRYLSLSSGIYFYTLKAGAFLQTKKMLLLK
jgi:hypothetical protein